MINARGITLALLGCVALGSGQVSATEIYTFSLDVNPAKADERPKVAKAAGELVLGKDVAVPAYQVTMPDGVEDSGWRTFAPDQQDLTPPAGSRLTPALASRLAAYYHSYGWILVPRFRQGFTCPALLDIIISALSCTGLSPTMVALPRAFH